MGSQDNSEGEEKPNLTWKELEKETCLRNVAVLEVEDLLFVLEKMNKNDITVSAYQSAREDMEGYIHEIKQLHASFRRKAADNSLLKIRVCGGFQSHGQMASRTMESLRSFKAEGVRKCN